jgi:hypothetical protein
MATKVANCDGRKSRHVLPNLAEGDICIWCWRLEVCCKRLGLLSNRHALRWEAVDETQTRLQVLLLVACRVSNAFVTRARARYFIPRDRRSVFVDLECSCYRA